MIQPLPPGGWITLSSVEKPAKQLVERASSALADVDTAGGPCASTCCRIRTGWRSCCVCTGHRGSASEIWPQRSDALKTRYRRRFGCFGSRAGWVPPARAGRSATGSGRDRPRAAAPHRHPRQADFFPYPFRQGYQPIHLNS